MSSYYAIKATYIFYANMASTIHFQQLFISNWLQSPVSSSHLNIMEGIDLQQNTLHASTANDITLSTCSNLISLK